MNFYLFINKESQEAINTNNETITLNELNTNQQFIDILNDDKITINDNSINFFS